MSLTTNSATSSPYASVNSGGAGSGVLRALEEVPGKIASGVEEVGEAVGDAASATVSFSARAMQALADGGMAVVHGVENVVAFPFEMAADAAVGVEHAVEGGIHLLADGASAVVNGLEAVAHGVENVIAFPFEMAADAAIGVEHAVEGGIHLLASGVHAAINGAETVVSGVANAAHAVAVDLPAAIAQDVGDVTQAALNNATTVAGAAAGVAALTGTSPIKMISSIL